MTSAPGRHEPSAQGYRWARDIHTDLARLVTVHRANALVMLMERHEYTLLEIPDLVDRATAIGIAVEQFPIANASVPRPDQVLAFDALVAGIRSELEAGKRVVLQCRDGISRTGLVAEAVAVAYGDAVEVAVERVRTVHPRAVATPEQAAFIAAFAARVGGG
jgi:protein-tyrosine phosphatase